VWDTADAGHVGDGTERDGTNLVRPQQAALSSDALDLTPGQVRACLTEARARGQPFFPWSDLAVGDWRASLGAIQRAVTEVLATADGAAERDALGGSPVRLDAPAGARALGIASFTSGTGPLLGFWIESGVLTSEADACGLLMLHLEHGRKRAARLRAGLAPVIERMQALGVTPTLIKGFHTAYAFFPDAGARPVSDIDLVVDPSLLDRATRTLREAGFTPGPVLDRPYMCAWTPPGSDGPPRSLELTHEANPWSVDLHASLDRDFGGVCNVSVVPPDVLATQPWGGAGALVNVLRYPWLPAYLAAHASQEMKNLTLVRLVELVLVLRRGVAEGALDWSELDELLRARGAAPYVYPAFELAERLAPGTVPPRLRAALDRAALPRVRRILAGVEPASAQRVEGVSLEESFMWATGPVEHARRIRRALLPAWAGSLREQLRVQVARARQLVSGRVAVRDSGREHDR
jgi:hypothetical protein